MWYARRPKLIGIFSLKKLIWILDWNGAKFMDASKSIFAEMNG